MSEDDEELEPTRCECGCNTYHWENNGIGHYEYWGCHGYDVQMDAICDDCGQAVVPDESFEQWKHQQDLDRY